jgi:putative acyl-CoA dehydrogenase
MIGTEGRGIPTILEMGSHTRLDCVTGTAGIMRAALTHALHHARGRSAFGRALAEQPLMQNVLADLALESEAATAFALRLARCYDRQDDPHEVLLARMLTPAGKYWLCKRGPAFGAEAMEVMGGNGYVEDGPLARLYREFPVNSIWEGSGNVMCLDVLRAFGKGPEARAALARELGWRPGSMPATTPGARACWTASADPAAARPNSARAAWPSSWWSGSRPACCCAMRRRTWRTPSWPRASRATPGGAFGRLPDGVDCPAILARAAL